MVIIKILIFFNVFIFSLNVYEEQIVEGTKTYNIEQYYQYDFIFNAIDDGTYVIIFEQKAKIFEATGIISPDIIVDNIGYYSYIYAQNFKKGNYVKLQYPGFWPRSSSTDTIRIQKIGGHFRLLTDYNSFLSTMAFNDCTKPLFIFTSNQQIDEPGTQKAFYAQTHFGKFIGSYRDSEYNPTDSISQGLTDLTLASLTDIPLCNLNIVKLQCVDPGIISFYYTIKYDQSFRGGVRQAIYSQQITSVLDFSKESPGNIYVQAFNLVGKTSLNLKELKGGVYTDNFYTKINYPNSFPTKTQIPAENISKPRSFMLSILNFGETNKILMKEKEQKLVMKTGRLLIYLVSLLIKNI